MKIIGLVTVIVVGLLLASGVQEFPKFADPHSPANAYHLSQDFITKTETDTMVPNIVTAVLADYRGYDTMFETVVVFTGGLAIFAILRTRRKKHEKRTILDADQNAVEPSQTDSGRIIIATTVRILVPVIQLFALYVLAHGHHSPGGGFQGGVILGASFILLALVSDLPRTLRRFSENSFLILGAVGILIYAGTGLVCQFLGQNFLDYDALHSVIPNFIDSAAGKLSGEEAILSDVDRGKWARSHAMLIVEVGVAMTVCSIMFAIYAILSSNGRLEEGL